MELFHAVPVFDMPMIVITHNPLEKGRRPQYPTLRQQRTTLLRRLQTKMPRLGYSRSKPILLLPL
jgi:hypothetical protein